MKLRKLSKICQNNLKSKKKLDEHIYVEKSKLHKEYKDAKEEAKSY